MAMGSIEERRAVGKAAREKVPRSSHAEWEPAPDRRDPVALLKEQDEDRVDWLVPVRHARMAVSPFTFYRGTARIMAADLANTPTSGLEVQLGGDAHLSNFGAYASPERTLIVDANDFDETLRGPWEWDLKRLATSFYVGGRHKGFDDDACQGLTELVVRSYRESMADFAKMRFLDLWYRMSAVEHIAELVNAESKKDVARLTEFERKARTKNSLQALQKLTEHRNGEFHWRVEYPFLVPVDKVLPEHHPDEILQSVDSTLADYRQTLRSDRQMLLDRYELIDIALKVVGVGSVGTRCYVLLLQGRDEGDPLFLQAKEANASVLEEFLQPSQYDHHGHRVVAGQRMIQSQSDILLGWATAAQTGRHFYIRQLRDWKGSFDVDKATKEGMQDYAILCGHILARGHARTGDPEAIAAYLGKSAKLDQAVTVFAQRYADQTLVDYQRFLGAIAEGELQVAPEPYA
jgi:uncharacterized protein (DUF2252 family)